MARFKIIQGSTSAHCCFEATVVDTSRLQFPERATHEYFKDKFHVVCECFDMEDAEAVCAALNATVTA